MTIEFWHPRKGGWYSGELTKRDKKSVTVRLPGHKRGMKVPISDVRELGKVGN